jgi:hypothetical protein
MTKDDETDSYQDQYLDQVWEQYFISGNPVHLAEYIEGGGEIGDDKILRKCLADILRNHAPRTRGKSNPERDVEVYYKVKWWRMWSLMDKSNPKKKRSSLQEAYRHFTIDDPDAKTDAFQKQYERGRKIITKKNKE